MTYGEAKSRCLKMQDELKPKSDLLEKLPASPAGPSPYADLYARLFASDMMTLVRWWFLYEGQISAKDVQNIMTKNMKQGMFRTFREQLRQQNPPT